MIAMRAMFAVLIMLIASGIGIADPVEDFTLQTCDDLNPTQADLTDLCTYQFDFGTYGDAPRKCSTTTDKEVVIGAGPSDALFVPVIDQSDHFKVVNTETFYSDLVLEYDPQFTTLSSPVATILIAVSHECETSLARELGPATEPLTVIAPMADPGTYVVRARIIEGVVQESPEECGPLADTSCDPYYYARLDVDPPSVGSIQIGPISIQTQCAPVCAANLSDLALNPTLGYNMKASRITT